MMISYAFSYPLEKILLKNFNTVLTLAKYEQKDAIVVFSDPNCFYCKKLKAETLVDKTVQKILANNFIIGEIFPTSESAAFEGKTYTYKELFGGFGVRGTPTIFFFDPNGKPITYIPGYIAPSNFSMVLRYIAEKKYVKKVNFKEYLKTKDTFMGTSTIVTLSQMEAKYIALHDPMSVQLKTLSNAHDPYMKYILSGSNATSTSQKMKKAGFYNIFTVR